MLRSLCVMHLFLFVAVCGIGCAKRESSPKVTDSENASPTAATASESKTAEPKPSDPPKKPVESQLAAIIPAIEKLEEPTPDGMNWLTPDEVADGWIRLFDGHTLFGWKPNSSVSWSARDGVITAGSDKSSEKCLLVTTARFADYELRCDYKLIPRTSDSAPPEANSGIFLRTAFIPKDPTVDCYELNMCDTHPAFGTASLVGRAKPEMPVSGDGAWHSFHVVMQGREISVKFDGQPVLEYTDTTEKPLTTGHIGLQMNGGNIEFRNVYLKPLGMRPLFDGKSTAGWHEVPGSKSQFALQDGAIHVTGGPGFLETDSDFGNFVFQFQSITNGDNLNSGLFFRTMTGTEEAPSNGYEFQLQNGFKNGNRAEPDDLGTGAIFRRVAARRVVSSDHQWLTGTLIADGPHFSTWVNGVQVVDWTDERPENENPRSGRRSEPGHFSLQGHDASTDIAFRNLRVVETPK